ncbi:MAG: metallophosphoesterase [Burkholderiaceae bacterium]|nr:metallophosphoesterase [Burkholderiaceae bacterium]
MIPARTRKSASLCAFLVLFLSGCAHVSRPADSAPPAAPIQATEAPPAAQGASLALIGDVPYGPSREGAFDRVIDAINQQSQVRVVLHTGDIKNGSERCDDALFQRRFAQYQRFQKPFVFTPGDNEWTDCHRPSNGGYVPLERLNRVRQLFFPEPGRTTGGRPMAVRSQSQQAGYETYVENSLWTVGGAVMATVHVVGSNNGLDPWNGIDLQDSATRPRADRLAEVKAREAAALAWIDQLFDQAESTQAPGVLVAMQANPNFELAAPHRERQAFNALLAKITARALAFKKPVVIAHGDSHYFRIDKPLKAPTKDGSSQMLENVTRVENFGAQDVHWVEITVDAKDPQVFGFIPHIIEANRFPR